MPFEGFNVIGHSSILIYGSFYYKAKLYPDACPAPIGRARERS